MAGFELVQITGNSWYVPAPSNIGLVDTADGCWLIDSGNDKDAGRKLNRLIEDTGRHLSGIVCTHSNADHIGGNSFLQKKSSCRIYASSGEVPFIHEPLLESSFLWGGRPFKQITSKFFKAQPSEVSDITEADVVYPFGRTVPLPGHFIDQIGILSPDGVLFLGDALFGETVLDKYGIPFIYDIESFRSSIAIIQELDADFYLPSHGDLTGTIDATAVKNLEKAAQLESAVLDFLREQRGFDELLKLVSDHFGVEMNHGQYILVSSTLRSLLSSLSDRGLAEFLFEENCMVWRAVSEHP